MNEKSAETDTFSLRQQDADVLKAIFEDKKLIREYAEEHGITQGTAELRLADALRRQKTRTRYGKVAYHPPLDTKHITHQGEHFPGLACEETPVREGSGFDDLDAWLYS